MARSKSSRNPNKQPRIRLVNFEREQRPDLAVYTVDRSFRLIGQIEVDEEGQFDLPDDALEEAHFVVIGPATEDFSELDRKNAIIYRPSQFRELLKAGLDIEIPKRDWYPWLHVRRCASGSVSHCFPYRPLLRDLLRRAVLPSTIRREQLRTSLSPTAPIREIAEANLPFHPPFLRRCETVCDGIVEVYRRTCCCRPWIIDDPRLPDLIEELEDIIDVLPDLPEPPFPQPDPPPFRELPFIEAGTLDERALNARRDLEAIRNLEPTQQAEYIQARSYLHRWLCSCGPAVKVGQGPIHPDGRFRICWWEGLRLYPDFCHDEYAYVVKQVVNGTTITIYDGPTAGAWFGPEEEPDLVSYHPQAQGCRHNDFPGEGAFALLQDIGLTGSYRLKTPNATDWDRVATPAYNDGLADPASSAAAAKGKYRDRNWGGTLRLRYHFSEPMKGVGATYYRISVSPADANGNPTGTRTHLSDAVSWKKYEIVGTDINVESEVLGPFSQGGENNLFKIPYDADADWQSGQYHGLLNTTQFSEGRYLLTLEVFDNAGTRLRPNGTGAANPSDPGDEADFTFRRWYQETGPTAEVPFAALTHMLWWDNRSAVAQIVDLRKDSVPSSEQCQFLVGPDTSTFSVGYRAYHPNPMFHLNHSMWWRRGLGGPTGYLVSSNPDNAGQPPNPVAVGGPATFASMLGPTTKCSFALRLYVNVKTFNGIGTLNGLDDSDTAAFALERTGS